jgi:hypothetical protein
MKSGRIAKLKNNYRAFVVRLFSPCNIKLYSLNYKSKSAKLKPDSLRKEMLSFLKNWKHTLIVLRVSE